ncbi:4'-phosphopantetheinyl transferase family protein [Streptomyces sp.]|uniref:4'-phosphopantetheinyl transferase family protein n=1 Tax=Streptomyces sp. TaxID=1931 RepID=UPI002D79A35D|nr:4'-phosphopantetheinyl transferase superfamily protein [Streptomyces sp.]HET6355661.1 4'-phosphopantetheinyl transferase superfamily protein [Streptomyces sp.]
MTGSADVSTVAEQVAAAGLTHVWLLPEHAVDSFAAGLGGTRLLTEDERARMDRLLTAPLRRRFLARRLLCRYALSNRTGRPLDHWRFWAGPHGRPEAEPDDDGMRFSLSHTEGLIVCAVTQGRLCGADVERLPTTCETTDYVSRYFAADERAELAALTPAGRIARGSELWVLKEAYLKALGTGLHRSLDGFSFAVQPADSPGRISVNDPERRERPGDGWSFELLHPGPEHILAIAVEGTHSGALQRTDLSGI